MQILPSVSLCLTGTHYFPRYIGINLIFVWAGETRPIFNMQ